MGKKCIVSDCNTCAGQGIPLHSFPIDENRKLDWIRRLNLIGIALPKFAHVCYLHFRQCDIYDRRNRLMLHSWAVPRKEPYENAEDETAVDDNSQELFPSTSSGQNQVSTSRYAAITVKELTKTEPDTGVYDCLFTIGDNGKVSSQHRDTVGDNPVSSQKSSSGQTSQSVSTPMHSQGSIFDGRSPKRIRFDENLDNENKLDIDENRIFMVSESQLRILLNRCISCGQVIHESAAIYAMGVDIRVEQYCHKCSLQVWTNFASSPPTRLHQGNARLTAATVVSGNTYEDLKSIASNLNLQIMSSASYHRFVSRYVNPAIQEEFIHHQTQLLEDIKLQQQSQIRDGLCVAMDGKFSQPGHTATFGVVTAIDLKTGLILDSHVLKKNEGTVTSSPNMEVVGVKRLLDSFFQPCIDSDNVAVDENEPSTSGSNHSIKINHVVTDDSASLKKMIRENYPDIIHCGDPWHLVKAVRMKLEKESKKSDRKELKFWKKSIINFLWTIMKNCAGDGDLLLEQWRSISYHVFGVHNWEQDSTFTQYRRCSHPITATSRTQYLLRNTPAHQAILDLINDQRLQSRVYRCRHFYQTSEVESYHALMLKYVPKRLQFGYESYVSRVKLAAIDWNTHVRLGPRRKQDGSVMVQYAVPPASGEWKAKMVSSQRTFEWSQALVEQIWERAQRLWRSGEIPDGRPVNIDQPLCRAVGPPDKESLLRNLLTRRGLDRTALLDDTDLN